MRWTKSYREALLIQAKMMELLPAVGTKEIANLAKGYATLETLKLRLRMKGAPKPVDAEKAAKRTPAGASFRE